MKSPVRSFAGSVSPSFTLTEILTATTVLSVLFTIMFGILQQTSAGWQAANRRVEASQSVRLAFEQICTDLEFSVPVVLTNAPLPLMSSGSQDTTNAATNTVNNFAFGFVHANAPTTPPWVGQPVSQPNDYIFVVTPYSPSMQMGAGDLMEVGYVPVWVTGTASSPGYVNTPPGRFVLCRSLPMRFNTGTNVSTANAQPVVDYLTRSTNWESTPGVNSAATNFFPIVDNCLGFDVQFLYRPDGNQAPTWVNFWGRPSTNSTNWTGMPPGALPGLPLAAKVTLCVIDERTAQRIYRMVGNTGLDASTLSNVVASVEDSSALGRIRDNPPGLRNILRQGVIGFQRTVYFKHAPQ